MVAITVTGMGAARCNAGVINALDLILLARKVSKNIPVACGEVEPLQGYHFYP